MRDTGRMMLVTEITAAKSYWQVCEGDCGPGTQRIYPPAFSPKVVGQIWSDSAQMQTWFGSSWWKVRRGRGRDRGWGGEGGRGRGRSRLWDKLVAVLNIPTPTPPHPTPPHPASFVLPLRCSVFS